jgi:hypothetical protein
LYVIQGLLGSLGRPINIGYFPLNKGIITEKQHKPADLESLLSARHLQPILFLPPFVISIIFRTPLSVILWSSGIIGAY